MCIGDPRGRALVLGIVGVVSGAVVASTALWAQSDGERTTWAGVYTDAQATRGEAPYLESCGGCHGAGLEGADMTPALTGAVFGANWNDLSVGDLAERIRISMPLDRPGKLTRQQTSDVVAFILRANAWPAGQTELPTEQGSLKAIKILAAKP
jgi:mono/diheme cytochrome c family protein